MRIRLIGLGSVGREIVTHCSRHFNTRGMGDLLESRKVIELTTGAFCETLNLLKAHAQNYMQSPEERRFLRSALAHLFFGGPDSGSESRQESLIGPGSIDRKPGEDAQPEIRFFHDLICKLQNEQKYEEFRSMLVDGLNQHRRDISETAELLGPDWLVTPDLPLEVETDATSTNSDSRFRCGNIGEELMTSVFEAKRRSNLGRLVDGLGRGDSKVDVVAIAFSLGDSFGGSGAASLAKAIRRELQKPAAKRIVAVIGLGVYEADQEALNGRYVGDYLQDERPRTGFDGLIARRLAPMTSVGFADILTSIAMSSDPRTIPIDNPDSNQLQRDFGRCLISAGYAEAPRPEAGQAIGPVPLTDYLEKACHDMAEWHFQSLKDLELFPDLRYEMEHLGELGPEWLKGWIANADAPGEVERLTARKVVVYLGHDDKLLGQDVQALRQMLSRQFPRARTVIYKYELGQFKRPATPELQAAEAANARAQGELSAARAAEVVAKARRDLSWKKQQTTDERARRAEQDARHINQAMEEARLAREAAHDVTERMSEIEREIEGLRAERASGIQMAVSSDEQYDKLVKQLEEERERVQHEAVRAHALADEAKAAADTNPDGAASLQRAAEWQAMAQNSREEFHKAEEILALKRSEREQAEATSAKMTARLKAVRDQLDQDPGQCDPPRPHLAIFLVDSFETNAISHFLHFIKKRFTVRGTRGHLMRPGDQDNAAANAYKRRLLARSLLSTPTAAEKWKPKPAEGGRSLRTCAKGSILGGLDDKFREEFATGVAAAIGEGEHVDEAGLGEESTQVYETVDKVQADLVLEKAPLSLDWIEGVLSGLNWLCNESVPRRRINRSLWQIARPLRGRRLGGTAANQPGQAPPRPPRRGAAQGDPQAAQGDPQAAQGDPQAASGGRRRGAGPRAAQRNPARVPRRSPAAGSDGAGGSDGTAQND